MLSLASFSSFQLISLLPSDWPDPGWGVLELRSASEPARSAGEGDWKHVRWSKPWNKFFIWPNPRNLSRQKIWRGWRGPSAPPEHKEAQIRTKKKEKQNCICIYTRGWNKNVKCRYSTHTFYTYTCGVLNYWEMWSKWHYWEALVSIIHRSVCSWQHTPPSVTLYCVFS